MKNYADIFDFLAKKLSFDDYIYISTLILENCMNPEEQKKMLSRVTKANKDVSVEIGHYMLEKKQKPLSFKKRIVRRGKRKFTVIDGGLYES